MENYNLISAKIVADSLNQFGERITTMKLVFPRFILAELNTHRMFNRNSASSRAIPFKKMVKEVMERPFVPITWQKDHKGMQGSEYWTTDIDKLELEWLQARNKAVFQAQTLADAGVTKQLCNRLLEPFMWHTVLVTATEWDNFFELRCPKYRLPKNVYNVFGEDFYEKEFKSIKDLKKSISNYLCNAPKAKQVIKDFNVLSDLGKLSINKGAAEIHMMDLAEKMWNAYNESTPKQLEVGQWHIPFGDTFNTLKQEDDLEDLLNDINYVPKNILFDIDFLTQAKLAIATARCARISYETLGDNPEIDYEKDIKLHDDLLAMRHFSPFEHCCAVPSEQEYNEARKGKEIGWFYNLKGFKSYRFSLDNPS